VRELDAVRGSTHALRAVRLEVTTSEAANEWIDHAAVTGIGHARNLAVGMLAEIGFARALGRYVVILEPGWEIEDVPRAATPAEAVELALAAVR